MNQCIYNIDYTDRTDISIIHSNFTMTETPVKYDSLKLLLGLNNICTAWSMKRDAGDDCGSILILQL